MSRWYCPGGQPFVGFVTENVPPWTTGDIVTVASCILVLAGAASPTSSATQAPRILSPLLAPVVSNETTTFGMLARKTLPGVSSPLVVIVALTFTSPARTTAAEISIANNKKADVLFIDLLLLTTGLAAAPFFYKLLFP